MGGGGGGGVGGGGQEREWEGVIDEVQEGTREWGESPRECEGGGRNGSLGGVIKEGTGGRLLLLPSSRVVLIKLKF